MEAERQKLLDRVEDDFKLHRPNETQGAAMDEVRNAYHALMRDLVTNLPLGRDLSMALTDLETSQRCAIAAIAKNRSHYE